MSSTDPSTDTVPAAAADDFTDIDLAGVEDGSVASWDQAAATERTADASDETGVLPNPDQLDGARAIATQLHTYSDELAGLDSAELSDHVEYYQRAHTHLQRALSDIDQA